MRLCISAVHELFRGKNFSRNTPILLDYLLTVRPEPVEGFCLVRHVPLVLNLSKDHHERSDFRKCNKEYKPFEKILEYNELFFKCTNLNLDKVP